MRCSSTTSTICTANQRTSAQPLNRSITGVITFSVWDGDWAVLEEYGTSNTITQKYLQGYHGLVKTLQDNIYCYQDELGSTSHIANSSGALLEYYKYDLYGKPTYWSTANSQLPSSNYNVRDLFTGQRWLVEIGLYDDRNRFMSPDLGRFIQPDPIGFKGDASNLYRYCGNDWANRTDPMGLFEVSSNPLFTIKLRDQFQDSMEITKFQQLAQQAGTRFSNLSNQNLQFGQTSATQNAQKDDGLPKKFIIPPKEDKVEHESPLKGGIRTYRWKAVTAKDQPVKDYNMTNIEGRLGGDSRVRITNSKQMRSDGIASDTVGYPGRLPGNLADFTGKMTNIIGNTVHAYGTNSPMTTEFVDVIQFNKGVAVGVSSRAIEPGDPMYIPQH